ncbi:dGTPase [Ferrithrix thermotolerans DSM 19514]|uniref:dGTPase n=1 Tax=Ferrithrix thermotolerans DSM 19514 TaxID=1121881 RepID=A0A1M4W1X0_9ACTN|nr:HD domain-containing protein [Ferrithrix thermotolerans]SHE75150.1 dGTPase [Ferrithrix thermotolerans DSM 19514]
MVTERAETWRSTMRGTIANDVVLAHSDSDRRLISPSSFDRQQRERLESHLDPNATRSSGAGQRANLEEADPYRTCFEVDRDRILHKGTAFRRLAGKTQVFIFPEDHMRTRLTHALEVEQVARSIASALCLNTTLAEAIALGHDCGHGPFGHASEDALSPYLERGFDHARFGADVVLKDLNLTWQTLDGIRCHSWSLPAPSTLEGEVVSWADRVAYVCHDFEDACRAGIVRESMLPKAVLDTLGSVKGRQLDVLITDIIETSLKSGRVGMSPDMADILAEFRTFNYEYIYMRPASVEQNKVVVEMLQSLVEYFIDRPHLDVFGERNHDEVTAGSVAATEQAVAYVAGMTDRFAVRSAMKHLGWSTSKLPRGVDLGSI